MDLFKKKIKVKRILALNSHHIHNHQYIDIYNNHFKAIPNFFFVSSVNTLPQYVSLSLLL